MTSTLFWWLTVAGLLAGAAQEPGAPGGGDSAVIAATELASAEPGELFVTANNAYSERDYATAIGLYEALIGRGFAGGELYYNLGNAFLRNGELGRAIASYRRSQSRLPRDEDVRANLAFARSSTTDDIAPPEPSAAQRVLFFWHYSLNTLELGLAFALVNLLFWGVWIARLFFPGSEILRWVFVLLLVLLLSGLGSLLLRFLSPQAVAVVVPREVEAFTSPDLESVLRFRLHAGTEVLLRDRRDGWLRIALPDGKQGWIEEQWAEVVYD